MEAIYSGRLTGIDPDTGLYSFQLRPDAEINTATDLNKFDNYQFYLGTGEALLPVASTLPQNIKVSD